ncbi:MAG: CCDC90 family protein [Magnetococcus sp. YQC-9]
MSGLVAAFDTHKFVKQMVATGFTEEQAETQVNLLTDILGYQLSTKADVAKMDMHVLELQRDIKALDAKIETTRADLQCAIKELDTKTETRLKELELRMVIKMGAMIIGGIGLLFGLMRVWPLPVQYVSPPAQEMRLPAPPPAR